MKAVILCGGMGTRLREETEFRPKPLVDVGNRPVLWHIMKIYAHYGVTRFVLCLGYKGHMIKDYFLNYESANNDFTISLGVKNQVEYHDAHPEQDFLVTLADTGMNTMTGGRIRRARRYIDEDTFMVTYGDGVSDVDVGKLLAFHRGHGKAATMTAVRPISRFGMLKLGERSEVREFVEKPVAEGWMNAGFFVFNRRVFDYLSGDACMLEGEPLERLAADGQLMAYRHEGFFFAMDTFREYKMLNDLWDSGKAPWKIWKD